MERIKKPALCLMFSALLLFFGTGSAPAQTAQQVAQKAFASTVLLVMEDSNGQPLSFGSGFVVRKGEIASNLHVVAGAARGYVKFIGRKTKYDIEGITAVDPERDLVVLKIKADDLQRLPLGDSDVVQVGESVYAVGNPKGLEGTFSQGIVSGTRKVGTDKILQITAPISPGSSGGPVLNSRGEVIGISVATFKGGQNLNFAIPANYLETLLTSAGPAKPFSKVKAVKDQSSILAKLGGRSTEGVVGGKLDWKYSSNFGNYSFSIQNKLREPVKNVFGLIIFRDKKGDPVDVEMFSLRPSQFVPAGLAKRVTGQVDGSVQKLSSNYEFRILGFDIVE